MNTPLKSNTDLPTAMQENTECLPPHNPKIQLKNKRKNNRGDLHTVHSEWGGYTKPYLLRFLSGSAARRRSLEPTAFPNLQLLRVCPCWSCAKANPLRGGNRASLSFVGDPKRQQLYSPKQKLDVCLVWLLRGGIKGDRHSFLVESNRKCSCSG